MSARQFRVRGLVQGVGFRPYVWRLATELGLIGWVRNDGAGVSIAVDGQHLAEFRCRLPQETPPLARIDAIDEGPAVENLTGTNFRILDSVDGDIATTIGPDAAVCQACLADICNPNSRRWRYAFTTCTHCGPRFTVSTGIPYDRSRTSLAPFPLCPNCLKEYTDPADRRFHAETTCCPTCGPKLQLLDHSGRRISVDRAERPETASADATDPIALTLAQLRAGRIVAIKGLGGFHLACDARNANAVAELRRRKQRDAKPFAVMALNVASLREFALIDDNEAALLASAAAPIVLCEKGERELPGIAPGLAHLGIMLPSTPLHWLVWHEAAGRPSGTEWTRQPAELLLVMTSANPHGEPLVSTDNEALARRGAVRENSAIADAFLTHDRDIVVRCDDTVMRIGASGPRFLRRARAYVPSPVRLAKGGPSVLALGGHLKNTICVMKGREAFLSQHVGSLDNAATIGFLEETVAHLLAILDVKPDLIAHDAHPDYASTLLAHRLAEQLGIQALAVHHHHAHLAAIAAEHQLREPLIGLALDGVGLGTDGTAWGGELLRLDRTQCARLGHLQPLRLPGGDRAAREPWRMAVSALHQAGLAQHIAAWQRISQPGFDVVPLLTLLERKVNCPLTSSLGRWFDAAAGVLGIVAKNHYEAQAAMQLEALATRHLRQHGKVPAQREAWCIRTEAGVSVLDLSPLLRQLLALRLEAGIASCPQDGDFANAKISAHLGHAAALFHATLAAALTDWVLTAVDDEKPTKIAIVGGCALNTLLVDDLREHLARAGIELLEAQQAPPNDGGLALGQAWVARQCFKERKNVSGNSGAGR